MDTIILVVTPDKTLELFEKMFDPYYQIQHIPRRNRITLVERQTPNRHAYFYREELGDDFEPAEREKILSKIANPITFNLESSDHDFLREVLLRIDVDGLIVDTWCRILKSHEYLEKLRQNPTWDWRERP